MQRGAQLDKRTACRVQDLPAIEWLSALGGALILFVMSYPTIRYLA